MTRGFVVALLGAESTGKTTLAQQLAATLRDRGEARVAVVAEYLREFCELHGRAPHVEEQAGIVAEQMRRIDAAAERHHIVVADTTGLMVSVYSELVFADRSLYAAAEAAHRRSIDLTLLTAPDIPWVPDGLQRDGPHVREPVDRLVRSSLNRAKVTFGVIFGSGAARLRAALQAFEHARRPVCTEGDETGDFQRWQWQCEHCDDGACERHALWAKG